MQFKKKIHYVYLISFLVFTILCLKATLGVVI